MTEINKSFTDKNFWNDYYKDYQPKTVGNIIFSDIFNKYLRNDLVKTVLEVGCAGGNFLCYMAKNFSYKAFGIDYSDEIGKTIITFRHNGLSDPTLYKRDFFHWEEKDVFDVVCSFGFIEHFQDLAMVIQKHADRVAPGGIMIVTMPHFAHLQYIFHWLIDRENLKKHNTKIMNLHSLKNAFNGIPFEIKHLSYYRTFGFWTERKDLKIWERIIQYCINFFGRVLWKIFGLQYPNFLVSPHIICVAKKIAK